MDTDDEHAFADFVAANGDRLLRFARLVFLDAGAAEDALQEALLRLTRHWARGLEHPEAYVRTALVNLARDGARRAHRVPVPVEVLGSGPITVDPAVAEARDELDRLLRPLAPKQRTTVVLRVIEGYDVAETAALMRCSEGTVKSNLARALARLRADLPDLPDLPDPTRTRKAQP